jgi:hypothetical protein
MRVVAILVPAVALGLALGWLVGLLPGSRWIIVLVLLFVLGWAIGQLRKIPRQ